MATRKKTTKKTGSRKSVKKKVSRGKRNTGVSSRKRNTSRPRRKRRWLKWMLLLLTAGLLVFVTYLAYLDRIVSIKFDGKRWAVPARVYGRPLELFVGAPISTGQFEAELKLLGYKKVRSTRKAGEYSRDRNRFVVRSRAFTYWDGERPSQFLDVRFEGSNVVSLNDAGNGKRVAITRLDPADIGSIYPSHNEDRILIKHDDLPPMLVAGLIVSEDKNFYSHFGVDPKGIARALWANMRAGGVVQGGSTITQQLVKNFYLSSERSYLRKANEALMAILLERRYSKPEILEAYANEIYLGQDGQRAIHGFGLASQYYFGRNLSELELHQLALLVALVRGPSMYNPLRNPETARKRRNLILDQLLEAQFISATQRDQARARGLDTASGNSTASRKGVPAFIDLVRRQLHRDYAEEDLTSEGLRIFTTLDPWLQSVAEQSVASKLDQLEKNRGLPAGKLEASVVVLSRENAEVIALVGGRRAHYAGFNRALDAVRPIGSLVKPIVFLEALGRPSQYSLVTMLDDRDISLKLPNGDVWTPGNYDRKAHGDVMLHTALARSYNLATVNLGLELGLERVAHRLKTFGVRRPFASVPSILLGSIELSPLEVAQLYQGLAAQGFRTPVRAIRAVLSQDGTPLQRYPLTVDNIASADAVFLTNKVLQEVVSSGTGKSLNGIIDPAMKLAGKTGTTDQLRDSWFAGFSGDKVMVVWVGRDDNKSAGLTGSSGALPLWGDIMRRTHVLPLTLFQPDNVENIWVDRRTGLLSGPDCDDALALPFIRGSAPTVQSDCLIEQPKGFWEEIFE